MRPVRIVARDVPYYSDDSQWWSPDVYFKGGQLAARARVSADHDPELYETERWGRFSYSIPVAPGRYVVILHFIEHRLHATDLDAATSHGPECCRKTSFQRVLQRKGHCAGPEHSGRDR